jgi:predicted N-acetyltransferase YhbS
MSAFQPIPDIRRAPAFGPLRTLAAPASLQAMIIRSEEPHDGDAIREVVGQAFAEAQHSSGTERAIVDALRASEALTISLVAVKDAAVVGHIAVSPVVTGNAAAGWFGLGPISVLPGCQRQGIGSALIREALAQLRRSGSAGCVVLGDPSYYGRFGFEHDPPVTYRDVPPPYFQILSFTGQRPTGAVEYHAAFEATN